MQKYEMIKKFKNIIIEVGGLKYFLIDKTQTASCKYGLKVALDSIKSRGRRDYGARYYNSLLFN